MMKIAFIHQAPHRLHAAWARAVTKRFYPCVPNFIFNRKKIYNFVYKHTVINQILCLFNSLFIPKADIYIIEGLKTALPAIINKRKKTRIILINSDTFFYNYKKSNFIMKQIYRKYLKYVDGMISTSFFMKDMAEKYSFVPNEVVYPFVNQKYLKVNTDINSKNVIFTGRLVKAKGIGMMITSFLRTSKEYKDKLYLVGKVEEKIKEIETPHKDIIVTGWVNNVEDYLKKSSIFLNFATHESFGVSVLEAMAVGVIPIIAKDCGVKELIKKVSKKLICKRYPEELAQKIVWINSNKRKKIEMSKKCKKIAKNFTKQKSVLNFKKTFNMLVTSLFSDE